MMKELFIAWILSIMTAIAPVDRRHVEPEAIETATEAEARYQEIAEAIIDGVYDESVTPAFRGKEGRANTAALVTIVFYTETGFRKDLDLGTSRDRLRPAGMNDFGRSWCMGQLNLGRKVVGGVETSPLATPEGWKGPELLADRKKCVIATVNALRRSRGACRGLPLAEQLAMYAAGNCEWDIGKQKSRVKMDMYHRWVRRGRPEGTDQQLLSSLRGDVEGPLSLLP